MLHPQPSQLNSEGEGRQLYFSWHDANRTRGLSHPRPPALLKSGVRAPRNLERLQPHVLGLSGELSSPQPLLRLPAPCSLHPTPPVRQQLGSVCHKQTVREKQPPQIECAPSRLTIRGHSSNSCHQDYKPDVFLCTCAWLGAVVRVKTEPSADRLVDPPRRAPHAADEYVNSHVLRMASPDCRGVI